MPATTTPASLVVEHRRFTQPVAATVVTRLGFAADPAELIKLYRAMVLTRTFDAKAVALQRQSAGSG